MNLKKSITTTSPQKARGRRHRDQTSSPRAPFCGLSLRRLALAFVAVALIAAPAFAHGGFDHVLGTVVKVANNVLTVKTTKGNVDVKLDDKTEITKNSAKAAVTDLTPGVRVVVDIPEGNKDKLAHSVKIGTAAATTAAHK